MDGWIFCTVHQLGVGVGTVFNYQMCRDAIGLSKEPMQSLIGPMIAEIQAFKML
jgi:hypothetical protein